MATYKLDIIARHGKYYSVLYPAGGGKGNPLDNEPADNIGDILENLEEEIESKGLDEENDSIIFRQIAYDDFTSLAREIKRATY